MKSCGKCQQQNQDDANFCYQCGNDLASPKDVSDAAAAPAGTRTDQDLWRDFIGPNAERYLDQFKKFGPPQSPRFALTWNWPAFLFVSFLWFLYRKMYLYAVVYAIGPMISTYLTGDMSSGMVWSVVAGATANYVYYWHCREQVAAIKQQAWNDQAKQHMAMKESGGVQPYVIWVGVVFYVIFSLTIFKMIQEGGLDPEKSPGKSAKPAGNAATNRLQRSNAAAASSSTPGTNPSPARRQPPRNRPMPVFAPIAYTSAASFSATSS
jgi:hypothetical protein